MKLIRLDCESFIWHVKEKTIFLFLSSWPHGPKPRCSFCKIISTWLKTVKLHRRHFSPPGLEKLFSSPSFVKIPGSVSAHWAVYICKTCLKPCILNLRSGQIRVQVLPLPLLHSLCVPLNNAGCSESMWNYISWKRRAVRLHSSIMESLCCQFVFVARPSLQYIAQLSLFTKRSLVKGARRPNMQRQWAPTCRYSYLLFSVWAGSMPLYTWFLPVMTEQGGSEDYFWSVR